MGNCCSNSVDFNGEPSLYHFNLHRPIGKGAFGKVCRTSPFLILYELARLTAGF